MMIIALFLILLAAIESIRGEHFDSDGRLIQVEYANKAAMQGGTVIGIRSNFSAVLFTWTERTGDDDFPESPPRKIRKLTESIGLGSSGIVSDVDFLANKMFEEANDYLYLFKSDPPAIRIAQSIADFMHERTLSARYRPMGVRMCVASFDAVANATITEIDPIGNIHRCELSCLGPHAGKIVEKWDKSVDMSGWDAPKLVRECLRVLRRCLHEADEVEDDDDDDELSDETGGEKKKKLEDLRIRREETPVVPREDAPVIRARDVSVGVVGKDVPFTKLEEEVIQAAVERDDYEPMRARIARGFAMPSILG
jgi:20S proteasome alpha/beta subunit